MSEGMSEPKRPSVPELSDQAAGFWREASEEELFAALERKPRELQPGEARSILLNPFLSPRVVEKLLEIRSLHNNYEYRRDLAQARLVPLAKAMELLPTLYWRDIARIAGNVQIRPQLRRQAEQRLVQRLSKLALGERIALARIASAGLIAELRRDKNPRVFKTLLDNPRLTEGNLRPLLADVATAPSSLELISKHRRFRSRRTIRLALVRNRSTPTAIALDQLSYLGKTELKSLTRDPRLPEPLKRKCRVLLGEAP